MGLRNKYLPVFYMLLTVATGIGCRKFLTVEPSDKLLETEVFGSAENMYAARNGLYTQLAGTDLYGGQMNLTTVDILAQYYNNMPPQFADVYAGNYSSSAAHSLTDNIWSSAYNLIMQDNIFLHEIQRSTGIVSSDIKNIALGEAYGLRAFLHFDMLRLYGPVYSIDSTASAIPYNNSDTLKLYDFLPANKVIELINGDLDSSIALLASDPIQTQGARYTSDDPTADETFLQTRNLRFNIFAAKALQARVALYAGNKPLAYRLATSLIGSTKNIFPWASGKTATAGQSNSDPLFSSEVIFAANDVNLSTAYQNYFSPDLDTTEIVDARSSFVSSLYGNNPNDYRYKTQWASNASAANKDTTFIKYKQPTSTSNPVLYMIPLIRVSELYYIAAETDPVPADGLAYLDSVRAYRNYDFGRTLPKTADVNSEVMNEYRKEFWGEGQLFFYYKRRNLNLSAIPTLNPQALSSGYYVLPMPETEIISH